MIVPTPPLLLTTPAVTCVVGFSFFFSPSDVYFGRIAAEKDGCYLCQLQEEGSMSF